MNRITYTPAELGGRGLPAGAAQYLETVGLPEQVGNMVFRKDGDSLSRLPDLQDLAIVGKTPNGREYVCISVRDACVCLIDWRRDFWIINSDMGRFAASLTIMSEYYGGRMPCYSQAEIQSTVENLRRRLESVDPEVFLREDGYWEVPLQLISDGVI